MKKLNMGFVNIGTDYVNGYVVSNNAVKSEASYTPEDWLKLLNGEEVPSEWDEEGNVTAYDFICDEE